MEFVLREGLHSREMREAGIFSKAMVCLSAHKQVVDETFLIPDLLSGIVLKYFYGFGYVLKLQWHCPWFILEPSTKTDTKAIWDGGKTTKS